MLPLGSNRKVRTTQNAAPELMPNTPGEARGFRVSACASAPAEDLIQVVKHPVGTLNASAQVPGDLVHLIDLVGLDHIQVLPERVLHPLVLGLVLLLLL